MQNKSNSNIQNQQVLRQLKYEQLSAAHETEDSNGKNILVTVEQKKKTATDGDTAVTIAESNVPDQKAVPQRDLSFVIGQLHKHCSIYKSRTITWCHEPIRQICMHSFGRSLVAAVQATACALTKGSAELPVSHRWADAALNTQAQLPVLGPASAQPRSRTPVPGSSWSCLTGPLVERSHACCRFAGAVGPSPSPAEHFSPAWKAQVSSVARAQRGQVGAGLGPDLH